MKSITLNNLEKLLRKCIYDGYSVDSILSPLDDIKEFCIARDAGFAKGHIYLQIIKPGYVQRIHYLIEDAETKRSSMMSTCIAGTPKPNPTTS